MLTGNDVIKAFEKNYPELFKTILEFEFAPLAILQKPKEERETFKLIPLQNNVNPTNTEMWVTRPFFFDHTKMPKTFMGFTVLTLMDEKNVPDEFNNDLYPELWDDELWSEEHILKYATDNADSIREQLNNYAFTIKDICDMMVNGNFESYKMQIDEERTRRALSIFSNKEDDEDDLDDIDDDNPDDDNIDDINIDDLFKPEK